MTKYIKLRWSLVLFCVLALFGFGSVKYYHWMKDQINYKQPIPDSMGYYYKYPKLYGYTVKFKEGTVYTEMVSDKKYKIIYGCLKCYGVECKPFELVDKPIKNVKPMYILWKFRHGERMAYDVTEKDNEKDLALERWYAQQEDKENKVVNRYGVGIYYPKPIELSKLKDK